MIARGCQALALGGEPAPKQRIDREQSGTKNENQQRGKPVGVGRCAVEVAGVRKNVGEIDAVVGHAQVGHGHVDEENQRNEARGDAERKEDAADEFNQSNQRARSCAARADSRLAKNCVTLSRCVSLPQPSCMNCQPQ